MLIIHRITPFIIGLVAGLGFFTLIKFPINPFISIAFTMVLILFLFARLLMMKFRSFDFWFFLGMPFVFVVSSIGLFMFLESQDEKITLAIITSLAVFFFAEHLFNYIHIPTKYQAYAIEHLSLVLNVLTVFFLGAVGFGLIMFLQIPLYILAIVFFAVATFVIYGTLWVSKVERKQAMQYGVLGALLLTEIFASLSFLPISFYANAAILALCSYIYLGLVRAHFLDKLSKTVLRRYLLIGFILIAIIITTTQWT